MANKVRIVPYYNAFNVDNTADIDKPLSTATKAYVDGYVSTDKTVYITANTTYSSFDVLPGQVSCITAGVTLTLPAGANVVDQSAGDGRVLQVNLMGAVSMVIDPSGGESIYDEVTAAQTTTLTVDGPGTFYFRCIQRTGVGVFRWSRCETGAYIATRALLNTVSATTTSNTNAINVLKAFAVRAFCRITCDTGVYTMSQNVGFSGTVTKLAVGAIQLTAAGGITWTTGCDTAILLTAIGVDDTTNGSVMSLGVRGRGTTSFGINIVPGTGVFGTLGDFGTAGYIDVVVMAQT